MLTNAMHLKHFF